MRQGNGQFIFCYSAQYYHLSCGHSTRHLAVDIAIIRAMTIPSCRIKYSTSDKTCQQVGRPILSNICTLGMENVLAPTRALGVPMSLCVSPAQIVHTLHVCLVF